MKFAICIWEFDATAEFADSLAADGVEFVEPGYPFLTSRSRGDFVKGVATLRAAGVEVRSAHAPFGDDADLSVADEIARKIAMRNHRDAIERAAEAGVEVLVLHPDSRYEVAEEDKKEILARFLQSVEELAEHSMKLDGPVLAVENMPPGHPLAGFATPLEVAGKLDSPKVGVCLDTGHAFLAGEALDANIRAAGTKLVNIHMHDNDGAWDKHIQPPYGATDWRPFAAELRSSPPACPISIEAVPFANGGRGDMLREIGALLDGKLFTVESGGGTFFCRCPVCSGVVVEVEGAPRCRCEAHSE